MILSNYTVKINSCFNKVASSILALAFYIWNVCAVSFKIQIIRNVKTHSWTSDIIVQSNSKCLKTSIISIFVWLIPPASHSRSGSHLAKPETISVSLEMLSTVSAETFLSNDVQRV